jgi:hypothetical protein
VGWQRRTSQQKKILMCANKKGRRQAMNLLAGENLQEQKTEEEIELHQCEQ